MTFNISDTTTSANPADPEYQDGIDRDKIVNSLKSIEDRVFDTIKLKLKNESYSKKRDRANCDGIFGIFSYRILIPYYHLGITSRAAKFAITRLIPMVFELEKELSCEFHKGALFYDTALAFLENGDDSRFEYYLAMADDEDVSMCSVEGHTHQRGAHNLKQYGLSAYTIESLVTFTVEFANGSKLSTACPIVVIAGVAMTEANLNTWRMKLDGYHHAELFRFLKEIRIFCGLEVPEYLVVYDHPHVMLRLVKALAHLAQWGESQLTYLQSQTGLTPGKTLSPKLANDPEFHSLVSISCGSLPGNSPMGADVDTVLQRLLSEIKGQSNPDEISWRCLRILYIVRNATAHQIESTLALYDDRQYLLDVMQATLMACFVIQQRKGVAVV